MGKGQNLQVNKVNKDKQAKLKILFLQNGRKFT